MALTRLSTLATPTVVAKSNLDQYFDLMTGVMADQPVTIAHDLMFSRNLGGVYPSPSGTLGGGSLDWNFSNGNAEVDFWNLYWAAGQSFRFIQRTGAAALTVLGNVYASSGWYFGGVGTDPGNGNITAANNITATGKLQAPTVGNINAPTIASINIFSTGGVAIGNSAGDPGANNFAVSGSVGVNRGLANGSTLRSGAGAPSNSVGSDGDYYFRTDGAAGTNLYVRHTGTYSGIA